MILFIAPNPHKVKEREGFLQRVAAIDGIFNNEQKVYIEECDTDDLLVDALLKADMIYVHSIYQAKQILSQYPDFGYKIVTDLHGVVPEEEELAGNKDKSLEMQIIEAEVFKHGKCFVAVTNAMVDHFTKKYSTGDDVSWIVLPIFDAKIEKSKRIKSEDKIIYAGGVQPWQNVDKMITAINSTKKRGYKFALLTHSPEAFDGIDKEVAKRSIIKTVPSEKVATYYSDASMGFVLRDNNTVNKVACPTKLIEYLASGVVPIVLSPQIGDFKKLGYKYITLDDFISSKKVSAKKLSISAEINAKILEKLKKQTIEGTDSLLGCYSRLKTQKLRTKDKRAIGIAASKNVIIQKLMDDLELCTHELKYQKNLSNEYEVEMRRYYDELHKIKSSGTWRLANNVTKPIKRVVRRPNKE